MNRALVLVGLLAVGCGQPIKPPNPPTQEQIDQSKATVKLAMELGEMAREALELLGLLPKYTCGEPRSTIVGQAVQELTVAFPCSTLTTTHLTEKDQVLLTMPSEGCAARSHTFTGTATFDYNGGEDRYDLAGDLRELHLDGKPMLARVGYGTCADETRYSAYVEGAIPAAADVTAMADLHVGKRDGLPIIGDTEILLTGPGELRRTAGTDRATFADLDYEVGAYSPKGGSLLVETAGGTRVLATFDEGLWKVGKLTLTIDDKDPVTVPIPQ